jgi:hypothetical protein
VYRSQQAARRIGVVAVYALAGAAAGALAGATGGALGQLLSDDLRIILATLLSAVLAGLGLAAVTGKFARPPSQCDRETPQRWARGGGGVRWGLYNGSALGFGAFSRVGFVLWYVIPAGAVLSASPAFGAALWGIYGLARTGSAGAVWAAMTWLPGFDALWLAAQKPRAYTLTAVVASAIGVATFLEVGL